MPNQLDATGLQTDSYDELLAYYTAQFQAIYGSDINLASDTPDGQWMNIIIQTTLDLLNLVTQVYNGFDPDLAVGNVLDQRVAINGIQRQGGTYTITPVTLVTNASTNLYGIDQSGTPTSQPVYTVADNAGNQWLLQTTQLGIAAGTYILNFQAQNAGAVLTVPNSITVPVSVVLGVVSINNPTTYLSLGQNEETDAALRIRRQQSVSQASQGYLKGLLAQLLNITGVTAAFVYENTGDAPDGDGVPGHSIWVIVSGTGTSAAIAQAIYDKRNAGCGMYGSTSYVITQVDGSPFIVYWDSVVTQNLFIQFTVTSINGVTAPNIAAIRAGLANLVKPGVYQEVNINEVATAVQEIDQNTLVTNAGLSLTAVGGYANILTPTTKKNQFSLAPANIIILPMQLQPATNVVLNTTGTVAFSGLGGYGALTYSISVNNSGGTINATSGAYAAGPTGGVTDTVRVDDTLGNFATASVQVL